MLCLCLLHAHILKLFVLVNQIFLKYFLLCIESGLHLSFNPSDGLISFFLSLLSLLLFLSLLLKIFSLFLNILYFLLRHEVLYSLLHFILNSALLLHNLLFDILLEFIDKDLILIHSVIGLSQLLG